MCTFYNIKWPPIVTMHCPCKKLKPWRSVAGRQFVKYFFSLCGVLPSVNLWFSKWYGNMNGKITIFKEKTKPSLPFWRFGLCSVKSLAYFGSPYFVLYLGQLKWTHVLSPMMILYRCEKSMFLCLRYCFIKCWTILTRANFLLFYKEMMEYPYCSNCFLNS